MQFFPQATVIEKGVTARELRLTRAFVVISAIFADLVAFLFVVTNAQTLHPAGIRIDTAADAARALEPLAWPYAQALFAIGLIGASLLAASVLPLSSAYVGLRRLTIDPLCAVEQHRRSAWSDMGQDQRWASAATFERNRGASGARRLRCTSSRAIAARHGSPARSRRWWSPTL